MNYNNSQKNKIREECSMPVANKIMYDERILVRELQDYINKLVAQQEISESDARQEAFDALQRTGVITPEGEIKEKIVSWE